MTIVRLITLGGSQEITTAGGTELIRPAWHQSGFSLAFELGGYRGDHAALINLTPYPGTDLRAHFNAGINALIETIGGQLGQPGSIAQKGIEPVNENRNYRVREANNRLSALPVVGRAALTVLENVFTKEATDCHLAEVLTAIDASVKAMHRFVAGVEIVHIIGDRALPLMFAGLDYKHLSTASAAMRPDQRPEPEATFA